MQGSQYFSLHIIAYYHIVLPPAPAYFSVSFYNPPLQGKWSLGRIPDPPTLELFNRIFRILMEQFTVDNTSSTSSIPPYINSQKLAQDSSPVFVIATSFSQHAGCNLLDVARWALSPHARNFYDCIVWVSQSWSHIRFWIELPSYPLLY